MKHGLLEFARGQKNDMFKRFVTYKNKKSAAFMTLFLSKLPKT